MASGLVSVLLGIESLDTVFEFEMLVVENELVASVFESVMALMSACAVEKVDYDSVMALVLASESVA